MVRDWIPTGIKIRPSRDVAGYHREYYKLRRRKNGQKNSYKETTEKASSPQIILHKTCIQTVQRI